MIGFGLIIVGLMNICSTGRQISMRKFEIYKEAILGVAAIILSAFYGIASYTIELRVLSTGVTAATIPRLLALTELILGTLLTLRGIFAARVQRRLLKKIRDTGEQNKEEKDDLTAVLETAVLLVFYVVTFQPLGFIISSIIFMFLEMIVVCPKSEKRNYKLFAIVSVTTAFFVYFLFRYAFEQMLPTGLMEFLEYIF
jgi:putative tricarboxylic transport membrane protein